jgi:hypothetical protein
MRLVFLSPDYERPAFKARHVDGDTWSMAATAVALGHQVSLVDGNYHQGGFDAVAWDEVDGIVVHLWASDRYGAPLRGLVTRLGALRDRAPVVAHGFLATAARADLVEHVDAVVAPLLASPHGGAGPDEQPVLALGPAARVVQAVEEVVETWGQSPASIGELPERYFEPLLASTVFSVAASRGCRARCSFCAYNSDIAAWSPLPVQRTIADMATVMTRSPVTRFAISDNDFGGSRPEARRRSEQLADAIDRAGLRPKLSISIRPATLTTETINSLARSGVDTALLGVESFTETFLTERFRKKGVPLAQLAGLCDGLEARGISPVCSYILWHPWQTPESARSEVDAISTFGRHRVPQFAYRSRLQVLPGTQIERDLNDAGLLERGWLARGYRFLDRRTAAVVADLERCAAERIAPRLVGLDDASPDTFGVLAELKLAEWAWLNDRLDNPPAP